MCVSSAYGDYLFTLTEDELCAERKVIEDLIDSGDRHRGNYHSLIFIDTHLERIRRGEKRERRTDIVERPHNLQIGNIRLFKADE